MTLVECDYMANALMSYPSIQAEMDCSGEFSKVFKYDDNGCIDCSQGFDENYDKPFSEGGKYATITDFRNLFHIGIEHGKSKVCGTKSRFNADFARSIGGYPVGSILRREDGTRIVNSKPNNESSPDSSDSGWIKLELSPSFRRYQRPYPYNYLGSSDIRLAQDIEIPCGTSRETRQINLGGWTCEQSGLYLFSNKVYFHDEYYNKDFFGFLWRTGSMKLKISQYPDIYGNPNHSDEYVTLISCDEVPKDVAEVSTPNIHEPSGSLLLSAGGPLPLYVPPNIVPLSKGVTYYFFLEYTNGSAQRLGNQWLKSKRFNEETQQWELTFYQYDLRYLCCYRIGRKLEWPKVS